LSKFAGGGRLKNQHEETNRKSQQFQGEKSGCRSEGRGRGTGQQAEGGKRGSKDSKREGKGKRSKGRGQVAVGKNKCQSLKGGGQGTWELRRLVTKGS